MMRNENTTLNIRIINAYASNCRLKLEFKKSNLGKSLSSAKQVELSYSSVSAWARVP